ncbi:MAG: choice-of-anchor Q domain-containing protein [bacterium]|nr:choice-of-anchor Q domain-containing protein [bacterium]
MKKEQKVKGSVVILVLLGLFCLGVGQANSATIYYVNASTGSNASNGLSPTVGVLPVGPKQTIQAGVNAASAGDTVQVEGNSGTYTYAEDITIDTGIALVGVGTPEIQTSYGIAFNGNGADSASISGFRITIIGVYSHGISCMSGTDPQIINNIITGGADTIDGIYCDGSSPSIINNTITGNGMNGISCNFSSSPIITNDIITSNTASGIFADGTSSPVISYNDVWDDSPNYSGCSAGTGDISSDPLFVDAADSNYHLKSCSPCVDAGTDTDSMPNTDNDGNPRPYAGGSPDMGAYEYQGTALTADAGAGDTVCSGTCTTLNGSASGGSSPYTYYTYAWSPSTSLSDTTTANPTACPDTTTTYTLTVTDNNGCTDDDQVTVTVNLPPTANAGNDASVCPGACVTLQGLASGGTPTYSYSWSPTTGLSNPNVSNPNACSTATITYTLTVTDANGCTDDDQVTVTVHPSPTANAGNDVSLCSGTCTTLNGLASSGSSPYTYAWSPATGLNNPSIATPTACPTAATTYTLTVTDNNGCTDDDQVTVTVNPSPVASR